jgi:hypothetical protein
MTDQNQTESPRITRKTTFRDPDLDILRRRLSDVIFKTVPLDGDARYIEIDAAAERKRLKTCHCVGYSIMIRLYAGGLQHSLATFKAVEAPTAARIADMVLHRMGKWRLKFEQSLAPADYNYTPEQAEADWKNEPHIAEIIRAMAERLETLGFLIVPGKVQRVSAPAILRESNPMQEQLNRIELSLQALSQAVFQLTSLLCSHNFYYASNQLPQSTPPFLSPPGTVICSTASFNEKGEKQP